MKQVRTKVKEAKSVNLHISNIFSLTFDTVIREDLLHCVDFARPEAAQRVDLLRLHFLRPNYSQCLLLPAVSFDELLV